MSSILPVACTVSASSPQREAGAPRPAHHTAKGGFVNPWESFYNLPTNPLTAWKVYKDWTSHPVSCGVGVEAGGKGVKWRWRVGLILRLGLTRGCAGAAAGAPAAGGQADVGSRSRGGPSQVGRRHQVDLAR